MLPSTTRFYSFTIVFHPFTGNFTGSSSVSKSQTADRNSRESLSHRTSALGGHTGDRMMTPDTVITPDGNGDVPEVFVWLLCERGIRFRGPFSLCLLRYRPMKPGHRRCRSCKRELPQSQFWQRNNTCKACRNAQKREEAGVADCVATQ